MLSKSERADIQFSQGEAILRHMRRFTDFKNKKCLEIGCHFGGLSAYYSLNGINLEAIDCEQGEPVLDFAKGYAREKGASVSFSYGDVHNLQYENSCFDIIIMDNILEHLSDYRRALKECKRVLRKGGLLFMNFSVFYGPFGGHQDTIPWYHILPEPIIRKRLEKENIYGIYKTLNRITLRDIRKTIRDLEFKVIYFHRTLSLNPKWKSFLKETARLIREGDFSGIYRHMKGLKGIRMAEIAVFIFFILLIPLNYIPAINELSVAGIRCVLKK